MGKIKFIPKDGKYCRSCLKWKPFSNYRISKKTEDGLAVHCDDCHNRGLKECSQLLKEKGVIMLSKIHWLDCAVTAVMTVVLLHVVGIWM